MAFRETYQANQKINATLLITKNNYVPYSVFLFVIEGINWNKNWLKKIKSRIACDASVETTELSLSFDEYFECVPPHQKSLINILVCSRLNLKALISQNGRTHSNNSSAICRRNVWVCVPILWDWRSKG